MEFLTGQYGLAIFAVAGFLLMSIATAKLKAIRSGEADIEWREVLNSALEQFAEQGQGELLGGFLRKLSEGNHKGAVAELKGTVEQLKQPDRALSVQAKNFGRQLGERLKDPLLLVDIEEQVALARQRARNAAAKLVKEKVDG